MQEFFVLFLFFLSLSANFCSEIHDPALKFCPVKELHMHLQIKITRNCHVTGVQVEISKTWLVIDIKFLCDLDVFSSLSLKNMGKVLLSRNSAPTAPNSFSQNRLSTSSRISKNVYNTLVEYVLNQKNSKNIHIFFGISRNSIFADRLS